MHDVERRVFIANCIERALEGSFVNALEEVGEFFVRCQGDPLQAMARNDGRDYLTSKSAPAALQQTDAIMQACKTVLAASQSPNRGASRMRP